MNLEFEILVHKFIGNYSKSLVKPKKADHNLEIAELSHFAIVFIYE